MKYLNQQYVRWDDIDAMGHVNNAKYLTLAQEARFHWASGQFAANKEAPSLIEMEAPSLIEMVVAKAELDFLEPIYQGDIFVDVHLWVESIGNSSFVVRYEISKDGTIFAKIKTVQVAISIETKKSRPLNEAEREFLSRYISE